jgi:hypothetical protein
MANVGGGTLMMAIQAVNAAACELRAAVASDTAAALPDDVEMLFSYEHAARELRAAYEVERLSTSNLPTYDELVNPGEE